MTETANNPMRMSSRKILKVLRIDVHIGLGRIYVFAAVGGLGL